MILYRLLILCFAFLLLSCKSTETSSIAQRAGAVPIKVFAEAPLEIPFYEFSEFQKLLKIKDDNTYIINFWATWCQPCVEELVFFESINTSFADQNIRVILVSFDKPSEAESRLLPFIKKYDIRSEVIMLSDNNIKKHMSDIDKSWQGDIPVTLIYNRKKRKFYGQFYSAQELKAEIEKFINLP